MISLAIISGSGLPGLSGLENSKTMDITTPFGKPSTPILTGTLNGKSVAFLNRHGKGHTIAPREINNRANIYALKSLGVERILSVSACGSLRDDYGLGDFVIPDQLFDFTHSRVKTFFGEGLVTHVDVADPFCTDLSTSLASSVSKAEKTVHIGGTYITIDGTRFSTRAEANTYRAWGMSVVGMTAAPEAFLAREAEMCYAVLVHVTDYDVWHLNEDPVSARRVLDTLNNNSEGIESIIHTLCSNLPDTLTCDCGSALSDAFLTDLSTVPAKLAKRLHPILKNYL